MSEPLSEEEMTEIAPVIVQGEITDVICNGEVTEANGVTTTPYLATLTIESVTKPEGDDIESVQLPFASVVIDEDANVQESSCGWNPYYALGQKGTFYLTTNDETEYYSLVTWNGFIADEDSTEEAPPVCESPEPQPEPDTTASDDAGTESSDDPGVGPDDATASDDDASPAEEENADSTAGDDGGCASGGSGSPLGLVLLSLLGLVTVARREWRSSGVRH